MSVLLLNIVATLLVLWQFQWMDSTFRMLLEDPRLFANWRSAASTGVIALSSLVILWAVWR